MEEHHSKKVRIHLQSECSNLRATLSNLHATCMQKVFFFFFGNLVFIYILILGSFLSNLNVEGVLWCFYTFWKFLNTRFLLPKFVTWVHHPPTLDLAQGIWTFHMEKTIHVYNKGNHPNDRVLYLMAFISRIMIIHLTWI